MEPYIQPQWRVTFYNPETGQRMEVMGAGEAKQQAIDEAAWKLEGGPWHIEDAELMPPAKP